MNRRTMADTSGWITLAEHLLRGGRRVPSRPAIGHHDPGVQEASSPAASQESGTRKPRWGPGDRKADRKES
jgi:hypothetical protein